MNEASCVLLPPMTTNFSFGCNQFHLNSVNCYFIPFSCCVSQDELIFLQSGYTNAFVGVSFAPRTIIPYFKRPKISNANILTNTFALKGYTCNYAACN